MKIGMKRPHGSRSLAAVLTLAFLGLSLVVLLVSSGLQLFSNVQAQQEAVAGQQQLIAQDATRTVSGFIQERFSVLDTVVRLAHPVTTAADEQKRVLESLLGLQPAFRQVVLLNAQDQELAQASRLSQVASGQLSGRLAEEALAQIHQGERYIGPVYIDPLTSEPLVVMAVPATNVFGDFQGTLVAEVNLKFMWDLVDQLQVGESGQAYVVDRQGNLIAFRDTGRVLRGENVAHLKAVDEFIRNVAALPTQGVSAYAGIEGTTVVGTYVPLGTPDWAVVTELPWDEAYQEILRVALTAIGITVAMAVLAGLLGVYVARRLAVPLVSLTDTATQIIGGELELQAKVAGPGEVTRLATAFNSMTAQMRDLIGSLESQVEARTEQLRASADVGRVAASILDPDQLLRESVNLISDRFGFYYVAVFTLDAMDKYAVLREATGKAGETLKQQGHKLEVGGQSMVGYATAQRKARIALDVGQEAVRFANPLLPDTRSEIALPLVAGDRVLGALDVQSTQEAAFDESSAATLQGMADQIAIALNNSVLFAELDRNVHTLNDLLQMSRDVSSSRTLQDLIGHLKKHLELLLGVDNYYLALVDERQTEIRFVLQRRSDAEAPDEEVVQPFGSGPGLIEYVVRARRPLRFGAIEARVRMAQLGIDASVAQPRAYVGVPITAGESVLGVLGFQDFGPRAAFSDSDERLAIALANQLASTLENLRLVGEVQRALSDLDAANRLLTGRAWEQHRRDAQTLSGEWRSGEWVSADSRASHGADTNLLDRLKIPLRVRGQAIGEFSLVPAGGQEEWTPEDQVFAQALIDQVGQTLEMVRLLETTERLAGRERLINEINARVRQTVDVDSILQTAVNELGRSLGAARVFARIGGSEAVPAGDDAAPQAGNGRGDDNV